MKARKAGVTMYEGWEFVDQGTDEHHVYRLMEDACYEVHGHRLNRCRWLWQIMLNDEWAGRKEHDKPEDAMAEVRKLRERAQAHAQKLEPHRAVTPRKPSSPGTRRHRAIGVSGRR
jgi:hypothetical protein